jgi:hypothetical protein
MKKQSPQPRHDDAPEAKTNPTKKRAGLYGSQAPKPGTRNPSGDTVVQAKPAGTKLHGDKLSQPGYLEEAAQREAQKSSRAGVKSAASRSKPGPAQRRSK